MNENELKKILNTDELAESLGVSAGSVRAWVREQGLPHFKCGSHYRFILDDVVFWLKAKTKNDKQKEKD